MTTLEQQHTTMQQQLPAFLHGDDAAFSDALRAILWGADNSGTYAWTLAHLVSIAATDMRTLYKAQLTNAPGGFLAFEQLDPDADPAQVAAMRIVIAYANQETADAATLIRTLLDNHDLQWAGRVAICTAEITRQTHALACGGHS